MAKPLLKKPFEEAVETVIEVDLSADVAALTAPKVKNCLRNSKES